MRVAISSRNKSIETKTITRLLVPDCFQSRLLHIQSVSMQANKLSIRE